VSTDTYGSELQAFARPFVSSSSSIKRWQSCVKRALTAFPHPVGEGA
jgi:hypothetical protein